jgi:hypothetical protein
MTRLTIICEQYGSYWKFTPKEFLALCNKSIQNKPGGFELPLKNELKHKPSGICNPDRKPYKSKYPGTGQNAFSADPNLILYHPLDWERGNYRQAAREVIERLQRINRANHRSI